MQITTAIVTSLFFITSSHALAGHRSHGKNVMIKMDTNGDGQISLDEFQSPHQRRLEQADSNGDGNVTLTELKEKISSYESKRKKAKEARIEARFAEMDVNKNGSVTVDEAKLAIFSKIDANQDGLLTKEELKQAKKLMRRHSGQRKHKHRDKRHAMDT